MNQMPRPPGRHRYANLTTWHRRVSHLLSIYTSTGGVDPNSMIQDYSRHQLTSNTSTMSMTPEIASYPSQPRYDRGYPSTVHPLAHPSPRRGTSKTQHVSDRFMLHLVSSAQDNPPMMPSLDPIEPFVSPPFPFSYSLSPNHFYCLVPKCSGEEFGGLYFESLPR